MEGYLTYLVLGQVVKQTVDDFYFIAVIRSVLGNKCVDGVGPFRFANVYQNLSYT